MRRDDASHMNHPLKTREARAMYRTLHCILTFTITSLLLLSALPAQEKSQRVGMIGLDTSHSIAFARLLNADDPAPELAGYRVVVACPRGSADIESSTSRIPKYTEQIKELGVTVVDSVAAVVKQCDVVLLETNDGRPHLEQVLEVFQAGKPVFIDKPIAGSLADTLAIFRAAKKYEVPVFSSSSLRFSKGAQAIRNGSMGKLSSSISRSAASSTTRSSSSTPSSVELRGGNTTFRPPAAITGIALSRACWPAPASRAERPTARRISGVRRSSRTRATCTISMRPFCTSWGSTTRS